ncbi:hypothetical protein AVEN_80876-1 [Araneus ventricosus]|uniref:Uncharacterized protein n=1 Tax=Araneus ventricosus TaxID=182803 RepID=A0A4Y2VGK8_ARAVE|nr:hypothetical protein AVEN_80876-1 [Araneus ventricosus]
MSPTTPDGLSMYQDCFITGHGPLTSYLFPIRKTPEQLLCLRRTWHAFSLCHQVPPHAFLPPQVSSGSTHRSLDEINNQPSPTKKQNNRPPQLYHQPRRPT